MEFLYTSLLPVFGLIIIGYFLKKINFPSHEFWPMADKLTYYILMPALLIIKLSNAKFQIDSFEFILTSLVAIFFTLLFLIFFNKKYPIENSSFTSVVQGGIRFNTYVFLALCSSIFGDKGLILSAMILTFTIPFLNILCITIFALYSSNKKLNMFYLIKSILTNPLIISCFIGGMINLFSISLPTTAVNLLKILGDAALPLGLLSVGYALVLKEIHSSKKELFISCFAKFIVLPFFMFIFGKFFALDKMMISVLMLFAVLPTAPSAFMLARQLKGDLSLMTSIITVQTLLSALFIVFVLYLFI